jgi:hypothetical protein
MILYLKQTECHGLVHVIITKLGSPIKGYMGVVKDVLCGQDMASGLMIDIQLTHLNPSSLSRERLLIMMMLSNKGDSIIFSYKLNI